MAGAPGVRIPRLADMTERMRPQSRAAPLGRSKRFGQLVRIARTNGLLPVRALDFSFEPGGADRRTVQAEGLRRALEQAGGAFVKLGQLMSTRTDVLPPEYVAALSKLQQSVRPAHWPAVKALLEEEFRAPLESIFSEFDEVPIAAASIGQVHRGILRSGEVVAVKVQRPGIVAEVQRDVDIAVRFTRLVSLASPQARALGIADIAEQYGADLLRQVDFRMEALNLTAMHAMQSRGARANELVLPQLRSALSSDRVLVMEFLGGETLRVIGDRPAAEHPDLGEAMRTVLRAFVRQIAFDGVYHSDLHPGNIMLLADGRPGLVDFGSVGRLDLHLRETIQELVIAYLRGDTQLIADGLLTLAPLRPGSDEKQFRRELSTFITYELGPGARISVATADALVAILGEYGMAVPSEFVAAARGFAILEGTLRSTMPEFDLLEESRRLAAEQLQDQMAPSNIREILTNEVLALLPSVRRLPRRVDQIGLALETGKLNVNVRLLADRRDRRLLVGLVRQGMLALVGVAAGVLSLVYLTGAPQAGAVLSTTTAGVVLGIGSLVLLVTATVDAAVTRHRE